MAESIIDYMRTSAPAALPIFRSEQQMRLLGVLFARRGVELSVSDLAAQAGVAIATASREVERLEAHGILGSRTVGRSRFVSANWALPWAAPLASILAQTVGLPAILADVLADVPGIRNAYIFGSWAARYHGETGPAPNDVDLLLVGKVGNNALRLALRQVEKDLGLEVNPVILSEGEWDHSDDALVEEIRSRPSVKIDLTVPSGA